MPPLSLITGATGFVGSAVAHAAAARGHALRLLVRPGGDRRNLAGLEAELVTGDLTDPASLLRATEGCTYVFHVAADYRIWVPDRARMQAVNVEGTRALMQAALAAKVARVVYCSSVATLGLTADGSPADETTPVTREAIVGAYKRSKYDAEQVVRQMVAEAALPAVIVHPAAPVGPRDLRPTPTGRMILDAAQGRMPAYVDTGLNIVHVDDVAQGHLLALERGRLGEGYILGGENLSLAQILALVDAACGRSARRLRLPVSLLWPAALAAEALAHLSGAEPRLTRDHLRMARKHMFFSSAKAAAELGYRFRPASAAIADAVAFYTSLGMVRPQ